MSSETGSGRSAAEIFGSDRMWGLKEIPLPEPVSWWPQTPGWWLLAAVIVMLVLWRLWAWRQRYRRNAYRRAALAELVMPPFSLGEPLNDKGVYQLLNSGGAEAGYVFETEPLAPLPGFSGAPINIMVTLDLEGKFLDAKLINHNEPIFVSGLGEAPLAAMQDWLDKATSREAALAAVDQLTATSE